MHLAAYWLAVLAHFHPFPATTAEKTTVWPKAPEDFIPGYDWNIKLIDCELHHNRSLSPFLGTGPEERCDLANKWLDIEDEKTLSWYYPTKCQRCKVVAKSKDALRACKTMCRRERRGGGKDRSKEEGNATKMSVYEKELDEELDPVFGTCLHSSFSHLRTSFRKRLAGLKPGGASQLFAFQRALRGRPVFWVGDSIAAGFMVQVEERGKQVGADVHFEPTDPFFYPNHDNKSPFRFMKHKKVTREQEKWRFWHRQSINGMREYARRGTGTVLMMNAGVHFHHRSDYEIVLHRTFAVIEEFLKLHPDNVAVFVESTAQHFATATGGWCGMDQLADDNPLKKKMEAPDLKIDLYGCTPLHSMTKKKKPSNKAVPKLCEQHAQWEGQWRNELVHYLVQTKSPQVAIAPLGALTMPLWDLHIGGTPDGRLDCTHYCYSPPLVEAAVHVLARAVEWADKQKAIFQEAQISAAALTTNPQTPA